LGVCAIVASHGSEAHPSIVQRIEAQARDHGDRVALVQYSNQMRYRELNRAANGVAQSLDEHAGTVVPICMTPGVPRVVAALGILKSGRAYAPIDPGLHDEGLRELVFHTQGTVVLTDVGMARRLALIGNGLRSIDVQKAMDEGADENPPRSTAPEDLAYIRYTSGSTGAPKGVMHTQRSATFLADTFCRSLDLVSDDRVTLFRPYWHSLVLGVLALGAEIHLFDLQTEGIRVVSEGIRSQGVTAIVTLPSVFRQIAMGLAAGQPATRARWLSLSGEPPTRQDLDLANQHLGPQCRVMNGFGSSEFDHICSGIITPEDFNTGLIPAGRPLPGIDVRIVDEDGREVKKGMTGEVTVRCPAMSAGYWRRPDLNHTVFGVDNPATGVSFYRTGDVGRFGDDGRLLVLGRVDNQIKIRGHRLLSEEVEAVLTTHPDIAAAGVCTMQSQHDEAILIAYVVLAHSQDVEVASLQAFARSHLPDYMVPSRIFVRTSLPMTTAGKLDRGALARLAAQR